MIPFCCSLPTFFSVSPTDLAATSVSKANNAMTGDRFIACWMFTALLGCSSDGDILPKKERFTPGNVPDASSPMDAAPEAEPDLPGDGKKPRDPNANCVKPGTP